MTNEKNEVVVENQDNIGEVLENKKKLSKKQYIIISIVSFFVILLAVVFGFVFLNNSIIGSWEKTDSEISYVLTFKDNGIVTVSEDDRSIDGPYSLKDDNFISFDVKVNQGDYLVGDYKYKVISNFLEKKLELTDEKGKTEQYNQYKTTEPEIFDNFSVVNEIVGKWKNENFNIEYEFLDNGLASVRIDNIKFNFIYKVENQKIILKNKISGQDKKSEVKYEIKDNILKMGGMEYIKQ